MCLLARKRATEPNRTEQNDLASRFSRFSRLLLLCLLTFWCCCAAGLLWNARTVRTLATCNSQSEPHSQLPNNSQLATSSPSFPTNPTKNALSCLLALRPIPPKSTLSPSHPIPSHSIQGPAPSGKRVRTYSGTSHRVGSGHLQVQEKVQVQVRTPFDLGQATPRVADL